MDNKLKLLNIDRKMFPILLVVFASYIGVSLPFTIFAPLVNSSLIPFGLSKPFYFGLVLAMYALGQIIGNPIWGSLSDQYGIKKILLITLGGATICFLLTGIVIQSDCLQYLLLTRFVTGLFEGNITLAQSAAFSISDKTPQQKSKNISLVYFACNMGFLMGPAIGATLSTVSFFGKHGYYSPFYFTTALTIMAFLYVNFSFKEVIQKVSSSGVLCNKASLKQAFVMDKSVRKLLFLAFLCFFGVNTFLAFSSLYLSEKLSFNINKIGLINVVFSSAIGLAYFFIIPKITKKIPTLFVLTTSVSLAATFILFFMLCRTVISVILIMPIIGLLTALCTTSITLLASHVAGESQRGKIMGLLRSFVAIGDVILCLLVGSLTTIDKNMAIIISVFMFIACVFTALLFFKRKPGVLNWGGIYG